MRPRARSPSRHAPAVCEEEGPTITGPIMSISETMSYVLPRALRPRSTCLERDLLATTAAASGSAEQRTKILTGVRFLYRRDVFRSSGGDDIAAAESAFRTQIDDPVGGLDDVEVVLNDEHGVAAVNKTVEHAHQHAHVLEMETRRWLVKDIEGSTRIALRQLGGELDALGLSARERRRRLAQVDVAEPNIE